MPLTDLIRYLNSRSQTLPNDQDAVTPFFSQDGSVFAHFAGLKLGSSFVPVVEAATGQVHGHAAELEAIHLENNTPLAAHSVFVLPLDDKEFIYLDRMVRTLHVLNYLNHRLKGNLLLKVHPRHVLGVPSEHGLAFEELLRPCGLMPEQVTLELEMDGMNPVDHLKQAVTSYKRQGYRIAIHRFGKHSNNYGLLNELEPHIVRLDASLLALPEQLEQTTRHIHALGALALIEETNAQTTGIDLLQNTKATARSSYTPNNPISEKRNFPLFKYPDAA